MNAGTPEETLLSSQTSRTASAFASDSVRAGAPWVRTHAEACAALSEGDIARACGLWSSLTDAEGPVIKAAAPAIGAELGGRLALMAEDLPREGPDLSPVGDLVGTLFDAGHRESASRVFATALDRLAAAFAASGERLSASRVLHMADILTFSYLSTGIAPPEASLVFLRFLVKGRLILMGMRGARPTARLDGDSRFLDALGPAIAKGSWGAPDEQSGRALAWRMAGFSPIAGSLAEVRAGLTDGTMTDHDAKQRLESLRSQYMAMEPVREDGGSCLRCGRWTPAGESCPGCGCTVTGDSREGMLVQSVDLLHFGRWADLRGVMEGDPDMDDDVYAHMDACRCCLEGRIDRAVEIWAGMVPDADEIMVNAIADGLAESLAGAGASDADEMRLSLDIVGTADLLSRLPEALVHKVASGLRGGMAAAVARVDPDDGYRISQAVEAVAAAAAVIVAVSGDRSEAADAVLDAYMAADGADGGPRVARMCDLLDEMYSLLSEMDDDAFLDREGPGRLQTVFELAAGGRAVPGTPTDPRLQLRRYLGLDVAAAGVQARPASGMPDGDAALLESILTSGDWSREEEMAAIMERWPEDPDGWVKLGMFQATVCGDADAACRSWMRAAPLLDEDRAAVIASIAAASLTAGCWVPDDYEPVPDGYLDTDLMGVEALGHALSSRFPGLMGRHDLSLMFYDGIDLIAAEYPATSSELCYIAETLSLAMISSDPDPAAQVEACRRYSALYASLSGCEDEVFEAFDRFFRRYSELLEPHAGEGPTWDPLDYPEYARELRDLHSTAFDVDLSEEGRMGFERSLGELEGMVGRLLRR